MSEPYRNNELHELFQRLKKKDEVTQPSFRDVLNRPKGTSKPLLNARNRCVLAGCLIAIAVGVFQLTDGSNDQQTRAGSVANSDGDPASIDFDRMYAAIDEQFLRAPLRSWQTPSDELLTLNLDYPFSTDQNHE